MRMYDMQETTKSSTRSWILRYTVFHPDEMSPRVDRFCFTRTWISFDMHTYHIDRLSASTHTLSTLTDTHSVTQGLN